MKQLSDLAAIHQQMDQARRAGPLLTNFYPTPDKLQRWIEAGTLFSMTAENVLFILRRDRDFLHLSYMASGAAELGAALHELVKSANDTLTVDVLGKGEQVDQIAMLFAKAGFDVHCSLHRMTMTTTTHAGTSLPPSTVDAEVVFATPDDAAALAGMLEAALDRYTEQIPNEAEMKRAAAERKVLVIKSGAAIAGLLFFEVTGQSSLLRHWLVDGAHRDQRIGARLMRRYFADCKDVRRFVLWVISDNHNAIDRYRHYGYQQDGLIDQVLMRRAS